MKASELRLGNYVDLFGKIAYITKSDFSETDYGIAIESGKPILLTEKWLCDFGFNKVDDINSVIAYFWIGINPVTHGWLFDLKWLKDIYQKQPYPLQGFPFYKNGHFQIKYVHQLQNLYFALTGEELEFNDN